MKDASGNTDLEQWSKEKNYASMECNNVGSGGLVFKSKEELLSWVQDPGRRNGFVIVIKTSDYGDGRRTPRIYLACERSGQYRAHKKLKRDDSNKKIVKITGTKKYGCPFELRAHKLMADDDWMEDVACGMHNHAPAKHFEGHSFAGRLSEEETPLLVDMSKSMVRPKEILVILKQKDALNVTTMKTIYNVHHRNNVIEKAGRSQMQQLLGELEKHNYIERHKCDNNMMTVTDLFWAHPVSLDLLRSFPEMLIMDCTYKTNRYHLPLLEIVGVTSTDMSFSVVFAYLQFEWIDNYVCMLTTLRSLLDNIAILEVYRTRTTTTYSYVDALPVGLKPYICLIRDIDVNDNYGLGPLLA
ncbi:protein FAR1-RELATED SEQUENCE 5-like [Camellia sinensis]|uniref:protein FAR1-RELATED SEQUENCE 5-like n=1 Tax=Camellia sinensis TaxID=4442 RepID=UPI001036AD65|nr:protein FAR1-RELATED SEQUENCE 5-like [Camellia sinensis]